MECSPWLSGPEQCEPESREWPGKKCDRCEELGLACSANSSVVSAREPGPSASAILQALGPSPPPDEQELVGEMCVLPVPLCRPGHALQSLSTNWCRCVRLSWAQRLRHSILDMREFLEKVPSNLRRPAAPTQFDGLSKDISSDVVHVLSRARPLLGSPSPSLRGVVVSAVSELSRYPWPRPPGQHPDEEDMMFLFQSLADNHQPTENWHLELATLENLFTSSPAAATEDRLRRYEKVFIDYLHQVRSYANSPRRLSPTSFPLVGGKSLARITLKLGSIPGSRDFDALGRSPLHVALYYDAIDTLEAKDIEVRTMDIEDSLSFTPLHLATIQNRPDFVNMLLRCGARYNSRGRGGSTPLHFAAAMGHHEVVRRLIEEYQLRQSTLRNSSHPPQDEDELLGGLHNSLSATNANGDTAIALAEQGGYQAITELLRQVAAASSKT